ncbi:MAG: HesA/MoeB/ThiF family protein [Anaerolineae bacterium]|nr:HesA/MoeB/ThiF family protein [Anaerolineae bacterium]
MDAITEAIRAYTCQIGGIETIDLNGLAQVAAQCGLSRRETEIAALELGILPLRYLRSYGTVGLDGQIALLRATVTVIGLGGLGGFVVEGLARMGVGRLVLVDGDTFCDHNLNRQLLSDETVLGQSKAHVAAGRVRRINPVIETIPHAEFATESNLPDILSGVDVVVDALDRLPVRLMLQAQAAQANVPMVHGAIAGWMGQVMTILPGDPGLRALYGNGDVPAQGAEAELGCPAASPMMVAAWQVHETIKLLLHQGELLQNKMLFIDTFVNEIRILALG